MGCVSVQDPWPGWPHSAGGGRVQFWLAMMTQMSSHTNWQQDGTSWQTALQQSASAQLGVGCASEQGPLIAAPQRPMHAWFAMSTHCSSQVLMQQGG